MAVYATVGAAVAVDSRKTMHMGKAEYRKLMEQQNTCTIDGKKYRRLAAGAVTKPGDICLGPARAGDRIGDSVVTYYRPLPDPPDVPSEKVLERVLAGDGTANEIVAVAVWARWAKAER